MNRSTSMQVSKSRWPQNRKLFLCVIVIFLSKSSTVLYVIDPSICVENEMKTTQYNFSFFATQFGIIFFYLLTWKFKFRKTAYSANRISRELYGVPFALNSCGRCSNIRLRLPFTYFDTIDNNAKICSNAVWSIVTKMRSIIWDTSGPLRFCLIALFL